MKNLLSLLVFTLFSTCLIAQQVIVEETDLSPEVKAQEVADYLTKLLNLDLTQEKHVFKITKESTEKVQALNFLKSTKPDLYDAKLASLATDTDSMIMQVLDHEKKKLYQKEITARLAYVKQIQAKASRAGTSSGQ